MRKTYRQYTQEKYQRAANADILDFLKFRGYELQTSGHEFQLKIHDSLKIHPSGKWYWHSRGTGGNNPISLIKELEGLSHVEAVKMLSDWNNIYIVSEQNNPHSVDAKPVPQKPESNFILPEPHINYRRIFAYLQKTRKIDPEIIARLMHEKKLYECKQYHNCVFVSYDENGVAKHAMKRSSNTHSKSGFRRGNVKYSDGVYPFVMEGRSNKLYVFESPIEAMSHATLVKLLEDQNPFEDHRIDVHGLNFQAVFYYLKLHPEIEFVCICTNNDYEAVNPDGEPDNHGEKYALRLKEMLDVGYKANICLPEAPYNDYNELLIHKLQFLEEQYGAEGEIEQY